MKTHHYKQILRTIRWVLIGLFAVGIFYLIWLDTVPSGRFSAAHDFQSPSPFMTDLVPKQRVEAREQSINFLDEPVYTTLNYPRPFQKVMLEMIFSNPDQLFVEFGPKVGIPEVYELRAIDHPVLNSLFKNEEWKQAGKTSLYQKVSADYQYGSMDQFWASLPDQQNTGYYGVDWLVPYMPALSDDAQATDAVIDVPLRGGHTFYYVGRDALELQVEYQDINELSGADNLLVTVKSWGGEVIQSLEAKDDGEVREQGMTSPREVWDIQVDLEESGVYEVEIEASTDIIFHKISAGTPYFVAKNRVHLAGGPDYRSEFGSDNLKTAELYTSARKWTAQVSHRQSLQDIRLVQETLTIDEPLKEFTYSVPAQRRFLLNSGYQLLVEKGDVIINGRGTYAFGKNRFYAPTPWLIDHTVDPEVLGIRYLLTDYTPPERFQGELSRQTIEVNLAEVFAPDKRLRMQWSVPEIANGDFSLYELRANYSSDPVTWDNAWEKFNRFISREF
jgi:hypothetical protein